MLKATGRGERCGRLGRYMAPAMACAIVAALSSCGGGDSPQDVKDVPRDSATQDPAMAAAAPVPAVPDPLPPPRRLSLHAWKGATAIASSRDGSLLAAANAGGQVQLLEAGNVTVRATLGDLHTAPRTALVFSPDGSRLFVAGRDSVTQVWDVKSQQRLGGLRGLQQPVRSLDVSPDGSAVASAGEETRVLLWSTASGRVVRTLEGHADFVNVVRFAPDGRLLASGDALGRVLLWEAATGRLVRTLLGHAGEVQTLAFSPDGGLLATAGDDSRVRLWDAAMGVQVALLTGHERRVRSVAFSADGRRLASAGDDGVVLVWDVQRRQLIGRVPAASAFAVNSLAFDRQRDDVLFAASEDARVHRIAVDAAALR